MEHARVLGFLLILNALFCASPVNFKHALRVNEIKPVNFDARDTLRL